eukprot:7521297-Lingulodinium_polyedra.AAC.1
MLELTPTSRVKMNPEAVLSQWGCKPDMLQAGMEHCHLGSLRFTAKGMREVACCRADQVIELANKTAEQAGKSFP